MGMIYYLMNKNNVVAKIENTKEIYDPVYSVDVIDEQRLPYGFLHFRYWTDTRKSGFFNKKMRIIMNQYKCNVDHIFFKTTHACSLCDTFWIKSEDENICWEDVSLYTHLFNQDVSKEALIGEKTTRTHLNDSPAFVPEFTTDGTFNKCWINENNDIYLCKRGRNGREIYSEVLASELANIICKKAVEYKIDTVYDNPVSKCKIFTNEDYGFVPYYKLNPNENALYDILDLYTKYGVEEDFRRMIILDVIIFNEDRHMGNHGMLFNNDTMEFVEFSPVYDLNLSLFYQVKDKELENLDLELFYPKIGYTFLDSAKLVMNTDIKLMLKNLYGFHFSFRGDKSFSSERIESLEKHINKQIKNILEAI